MVDTTDTTIAPSSPATNLPPKVLIAICSFNMLPSIWGRFIQRLDEEASDTLDENHVRDTINASHVCRSWRSVLLSAPELWRCMVDPYDASWSKVILARSQPLGISFSLPSHKRCEGRNEEDLEEELTREYSDRITAYQFVCNLSLSAGPQFHYLQGSLNARYLPMLEELSISFPTYTTLPTKFPGAGTPNLKRLHLHQCFIENMSQSSSIKESLVHLHIDRVSLREDVLVNVLRTLPHLQCLILNKAFEPLTQAPIELCSSNFLYMDQLRELYITDKHSSRAMTFLACIAITHALNVFCLNLHFPKNREIVNVVPNIQIFYHISCILSRMTALEPLPSVELASGSGGLLFGSGVTFFDGPSSAAAHLSPTPRRWFHVGFTPCELEELREGEYHAPDITSLATDLDGNLPWLTFVSEFHATMGNLGAYVSARHFIDNYHADDGITMQALRQCKGLTVLEDVREDLWTILCADDDFTGLEDSENCVLPKLEKITFLTWNFAIACESNSANAESASSCSDNEEESGAFSLARPISPGDDKTETGDSDGSFNYQSGLSDYEDEPDTFIQDLVNFCKRRKNLRLVQFEPDMEEDILAELKIHLGALGVDVKA